MRPKLLSVAVALVALGTASPALADSGGSGALQAGLQAASTAQAALGAATSGQSAANANVPISIGAGHVSSGPSNAAQTASSNASTNVGNTATTNQSQTQSQNVGGNTSCVAGCGGAGAAQLGAQKASTVQGAIGVAKSDQHAANANVPVSIGGGNVSSGPSNAAQTASSNASTNVGNTATTNQNQTQSQNVGGNSSCLAGCGGAGGAQAGVQKAGTKQGAIGVAGSKQHAVNANVPVSIGGGNVGAGPSSATQTASSSAGAGAQNTATTNQSQSQSQNVGGNGSCVAGCGGAGGAQLGVQKAGTVQGAIGVAKSDQHAVNANVPVSIGGGDVGSGPSNAAQTASSNASTNVGNTATTNQGQTQSQNVGGSGACLAGCGGPGALQLGLQNAETRQLAVGLARSDQHAVNANVPVSIGGGDVSSGPSNAAQTASSNASTNVGNTATTNQGQTQSQQPAPWVTSPAASDRSFLSAATPTGSSTPTTTAGSRTVTGTTVETRAGVAGVQAARTAARPSSAAVRAGTLPFAGFGLDAALVLGLTLLLGGLVVRRAARPAPRLERGEVVPA